MLVPGNPKAIAYFLDRDTSTYNKPNLIEALSDRGKCIRLSAVLKCLLDCCSFQASICPSLILLKAVFSEPCQTPGGVLEKITAEKGEACGEGVD